LDETVPTTTISNVWTPTSTTTTNWTTSTAQKTSAPNSFFTSNLTTVSDQKLETTNALLLPANPPSLTFQGYINSESGWDGGVVEISTNNGATWTDLGASIGLASLEEFHETLAYRRELFFQYLETLKENINLQILSRESPETYHAAWLFTIRTPFRKDLQSHLANFGIETNQVHYRNDRYEIMGPRRTNLPNMDEIENDYLVLPLHTRMSSADVTRICSLVNEFFETIRK
jgi:dTDP-4-amino-4,6-dideoxygalactose transaminase